MTKLMIALLTTNFFFGSTIAHSARNHNDAAQKKTVSLNQAEKYCGLSVQTKYNHYAKYCKKQPIVSISLSDEESPGEYFRKDKELNSFKSPITVAKQKTKESHTNTTGVSTKSHVQFAREWEGYTVRENRHALGKMLSDGNKIRIDPARIPWCAAFANAVLSKSGVKGTGSMMAQSFLGFGVATRQPTEGDIAVFSRGRKRSSSGHMGFYMGEETIGGVRYIKVLGGNQNKGVNVAYYPANKLLGYRKLG